MMNRPKHVTDEHLAFLDGLRITGATNMFGAVPYIHDEFPALTGDECRQVLMYWMRTFSVRHPREDDNG